MTPEQLAAIRERLAKTRRLTLQHQALHLLADTDALLGVVDAFQRTMANLNAKLDETHTHRCFNCERTVTGETAGRQQALQRRCEGFRRWLDRFEAETRALPVQHEDPSKGQSSFNWRMWFVREARRALSEDGGGHG